MNNLMTKSLAQIVNEDHRAATVFEKYHLDFCCKGKRSLQQACAESQVPPDELIAALEATVRPENYSVHLNYNLLSLSQLTDYIVAAHHAYVKQEMPQILSYLQRVASKHGDRHPEMRKVAEIFEAVKEEMEQHMQKEELILFPRIKEVEKEGKELNEKKLTISYLEAPINMMEEEHDHAGTAMAEIRELTDNYNPPADACTTYKLSYAALEAFEKDLHQHVHLENNILFPNAISLFSNSTVADFN
ncbi:MAG: iron-sulfur cluster repair di-iron protein [Chitinophagaceae bacterium]